MIFLIFLLLFGFLFSEVIRIYSASDLQFALKEIVKLYEKKYPQDKVEVIFGSSGKGYAKIKAGAPYHLFFSANMEYVIKLYEEGYLITKPKVYAIGKLVVWVKKDSSLDPSKFPQILLDERVKKIAVANWKHAPYGKAAKEVLENYGVFEKVKKKLVIAENISQAASFVYSGAADVGLIALSIALSEEMKKAGKYWIIPQDKYSKILQGYGITIFGKNSEGAWRFYKFFQTEEVKKILIKYGFEVPD